MSLQSPSIQIISRSTTFQKNEKKIINKEIKVRWLENLKRLVRQKLGHSRCPENLKGLAGKIKGIKKKENPTD